MQPDGTPDQKSLQVHGHRIAHRREKSDSFLITDVLSQFMTLLLACISASVYAIVVADGEFGWASVSWLLVQIGSVLTGAWYVRRRAVEQVEPPIVSPLIVIAGILALFWEGFSRTILQAGLPFELLTMGVIRNLILSLAVVSVWSNYQRLCVALSLFLAMFGVTASHDLAAQILAGLFAIGSVGWLVVSHWENVRRRLHGRDLSRRSRLVFLIPVVLISLLGISFAARDRRITTALRGFLPSSGGDGASDPYSRGGIGTGDMLVAGTNQIQSFAPIDDAPFMQNDKPSLYDLFDDSYEEEVKISKTDRAIALPPDLANRAKEHLHTRTEKANREFSTLRQANDKTGKRHAQDIMSDALFYVAGRVPLHLRLQVYDLFDGYIWYPEQPAEFNQPMKIVQSGGKPWLELNDRSEAREYLGPAETHAVKVVNLDTNTIPAPLYLHGVHIDQVDQANMFQHGPDGLVSLDRDRLPSLVPIHLATRTVDSKRFEAEEKLFIRMHTESATSVIPETIDLVKLKNMAETWTQGADGAWGQISAIVDHLRRDYVVDSAWRPRDNGPLPVEQFLFESKRGPDYQFATAAAMLLRSVGFNTRVVSGFYADPEQYDQKSRHTPVLPDDVHFWTEVRVGGSDWITIESSPGYAVLTPPPGFLQRIQNTLIQFTGLMIQNWMICVSALMVLFLLLRNRILLTSRFYTLAWQLRVWWKPEQRLMATIAILRKRAELSGVSPSHSATHHRWLGELMARAEQQEISRSLYELRKLVDAAAYSRGASVNSAEVSRVCQSCEQGCSLRWFQVESERLQAGSQQQSISNKVMLNYAGYAGATDERR